MAHRCRGRRRRAAVGENVVGRLPEIDFVIGVDRRCSPRSPWRSSEARLARTSFMFMLLCVPDPVCQTAKGGNSASCRPARISPAASAMAAAWSSMRPRSRLTQVQDCLTSASATISSFGMRSPEMAKCARARWVCAPQPFRRYLNGSEGIPLDPHFAHGISRPRPVSARPPAGRGFQRNTHFHHRPSSAGWRHPSHAARRPLLRTSPEAPATR